MPVSVTFNEEEHQRFLKALEDVKKKAPKKLKEFLSKSATIVYGRYIENISGLTPSTAQFPLPVGIVTGENLRSAGLEFDEGDGDGGEGGDGDGGGAGQEGPEQDGNNFRAVVYNTAKHAEFLEVGTCKMSARHPLSASLDDSIEQIEGLAEEIFVRLFKEAGIVLKKK